MNGKESETGIALEFGSLCSNLPCTLGMLPPGGSRAPDIKPAYRYEVQPNSSLPEIKKHLRPHFAV